MAVPPQFQPGYKAKSASAPTAAPATKSMPPWLAGKGAAPKLAPARKKKARQQAISDMQKQDATLDAKLGANDLPDKSSSQPPWPKGK